MMGRAQSLQRKGMHRAVPWVLAMLCLRALVPAGFMLAPLDGRLNVVLCESGATELMLPHSQHQHHHHTQIDHGCPYAQSSGPAPMPALPALEPQSVAVNFSLPVELAQTITAPGPVRQHSARAPPHLT